MHSDGKKRRSFLAMLFAAGDLRRSKRKYMKALKVIGIIVLVLFALSGAVQLLISGLGLIAALIQHSVGNLSYIIGRFTGAILIETLVVAGLIKLIRSLRTPTNEESSNQAVHHTK